MLQDKGLEHFSLGCDDIYEFKKGYRNEGNDNCKHIAKQGFDTQIRLCNILAVPVALRE